MVMKKTGRAAAALTAALLTVSFVPGGMPAVLQADSAVEAIALTATTVWNNEYTENYEQLLDLHYDKVQLAAREKEKHAGLVASFNTMNEEIEAEAVQMHDELLPDAKQMKSEYSEYFFHFFYEANAIVSRADSAYTSLRYSFSHFAGGVHGSSWSKSYNFRSDTGERLAVADVVTDEAALQNAVRSELNEHFSYLTGMDNFDSISPSDYIWTIGRDRMHVYFDVYTLGSYAEGPQDVIISFSEYPELFPEQVKQVSDSYAEGPGGVYTIFNEDLNGDGSLDELNVRVNYGGEEYSYTGLDVSVGEQQLSVDLYCSDMKSYLVHKDGRVFVYCELTEDSDYREIYVVEVTGGSPVLRGCVDLGFLCDFDEDIGGYAIELLTAPDSLHLQTRTDICGTSGIHAAYKVGEDGLPVMTDAWFSYAADKTIKAKSDIEATKVDQNGTASGSVTIRAGEGVVPVRTDDETWVDLRLTDGTLCRMTVDRQEWPVKLNGTAQDDLFDNIMYAG
ncbi:MAG: RsiV family protein [Lachnospiraceae bacterium]|nr:RsiV family protein [Lachnospiraceae bacterium]